LTATFGKQKKMDTSKALINRWC